MTTEKLKAAILVISTTASQDPSTDKCIEILRGVFEDTNDNKSTGTGWIVASTKIVGDDPLEIQRAIMAWTDGEEKMNLIVTSGGTGFAVKDVTPEVCDPCLNFSHSLGKE